MLTAAIHLINALRYAGDDDVQRVLEESSHDELEARLRAVQQLDEEIAQLQREDAANRWF